VLASYTKLYFAVFAMMAISACSSTNSSNIDSKPIDNPFGESKWKDAENNNNITLRTRRGDQSVEVELPNKYGSDFQVPLNQRFTDVHSERNTNGVDYTYLDQKPTMADREIASTFGTTGSIEDERRKREIEQSLGLQESDDQPNMDQSYLAKVDVVKQLFRNNRHEAALIEIDKMIKDYPTNAKLYEMRGTVLDRMGYKDLALRSWKQSLEFNSNQLALKKVVDKRELQRGVASQNTETK
jgi:tetratricopeptide (TPR) repeat protein